MIEFNPPDAEYELEKQKTDFQEHCIFSISAWLPTVSHPKYIGYRYVTHHRFVTRSRAIQDFQIYQNQHQFPDKIVGPVTRNLMLVPIKGIYMLPPLLQSKLKIKLVSKFCKARMFSSLFVYLYRFVF